MYEKGMLAGYMKGVNERRYMGDIDVRGIGEGIHEMMAAHAPNCHLTQGQGYGLVRVWFGLDLGE